MPQLADAEVLEALARDMAAAPAAQLPRLDELLQNHPEDARLHFLRGSILIGEGRAIEAHQSLSRAVSLAPDFAIARFQLGFFQLTSGEPENALETWGRLDALPDGHHLRKFVEGLRRLIRDDFRGAVETLREGIALNQENPPLNRDMELIITQCEPLLGDTPAEEVETISETSFILRQFSPREH